MKTKQIIMLIVVTIILLLFTALNANGQNYYFKVLATKGEVISRTNTLGPPTQVKIGQELLPGSFLEIGENSYIGLMHSTGQTWESDGRPEIVWIDHIHSDLQTRSNNLLAEYVTFVYQRIDEVKDKNLLVATGGVTRKADKKLVVNLPHVTKYFGNELMLTWDEHLSLATHVITVTDIFGKVVGNYESIKSTYPLKLKKSFRGELLVIQVKLDGFESDEFGVKLLSNGEVNDITDDLNQLMKSISEDSSLGQLMLAAFYEKNELIIHADKAYQEAMDLSPDVDDFKLMYREFRQRNDY